MTNVMLERLLVIYGDPESHDPKAYLAEVAKLMAKYSPATLEAATDHLLANHRGRMWPTPAQCVSACEDVLEIQAGKQPPDTSPRHPEWTKAALDAADRLIVSNLGQQAAAEGWITQLHDHCRNTRMLPTAHQIADMRREARMFEEAYAHVCQHPDLPLAGCLRKLGDSFLAKRERLSELAHGVVP